MPGPSFRQQLDSRLLILDGAMGTATHGLDLDLDKDFMGRENCPEVLVLTRPEVIQEIHESFLAAGADAVETNTFGGCPMVLAEFDLADRAQEINRQAARIARAACAAHATADKPRFVIGSMGPGTKLITLGNTDWAAMLASYREQVLGLIDGGVDAVLIETAQDLLQIKCAINAALDAMGARGRSPDDLPIMVQVTVETTGTMLLGTEIAAAASALSAFPIASLGLNCATGPREMAEHVHWLARHWTRPISVQPNAGLPALVEGRTEFPLQPEPFAEAMVRFVTEHGVSIVGGCCGTTPAHIGALAKALQGVAPAKVQKHPQAPGVCSLYSPIDYRQETSILNIGERTNASGSRAFKRMLEADDFDGMVASAREQLREGSHVIDINVDYAGRDNQADMAKLVHRIVRQANVPLMLDSTQPATIEAGLKQAGGKCLINSTNLEEGESKFALMCQLAKRYGAGLVLGCIDEDPQEAMARTAERKIAIARRMHALATRVHGLDESDLAFDPLVLPISTGMDQDRRSALETIAGSRLIAGEFPNCQIICGLSNVSFGLKPAARQVLNSVFLAELIEAGITAAILHVSKIVPRNRIDDAQWNAALKLIYDRRNGRDPLQAFIELFPDDAVEQSTRQDIAQLPLEERLEKHIIDGEQQGLIDTLEQALEQYSALQIINDHLLKGMKTVGELFGAGQMQLPFVLQSAQVMKMAVAHLEPHMDKRAGESKGKIVLATVRGDVHDIGKNLVDIILTNNGYTVFNLGIKQPIGQIIAQYREQHADAIGLSGLLVKSVQVMSENLDELNEQGIQAPILMGGAALRREYCETDLRTRYDGRCYYGKDAFEALRIMDMLVAGEADKLNVEIDERIAKRAVAAKAVAPAEPNKRRVAIDDVKIPVPPFFGDRLIADIDLDQVFDYINTTALFRGQWQFKKGALSPAQYDASIEDQAQPIFERLKAQCRDEQILRPQVVYGYFPCNSDGDDLILFDPADHEREIERFTFPRQPGRDRLCLSDFVRSVGGSEKDLLGMTCVTVGAEVSRRAAELFAANAYSEYLYLHGLGVEAAEALAEMWHKRMRQELGIADQDAPSIRKLFACGYRGCRYSFGYPACPELSDQKKLFALLEPERIGCRLSDTWQIDPEQSTSAIIFHHPQARYFNV